MTTTETRNETADAQDKEHFDLLTKGLGYISRIRTVKPRGKGDEMLCCAINALRGDVSSPEYTYFDLRVVGDQAPDIVNRCLPHVNAKKKVLVAFSVGDIEIRQYDKKLEDGSTEKRALLKGRLIRISHVKVDGTTVYSLNDADQAGSADQSTGTEG